MRNGKFTAAERTYLSGLDAVKRVTDTRIYYSDEFREECMRRYHKGASPAALFAEAGLGSKIIGYKRIERSFARWKLAEEKAAEKAAKSPKPVNEDKSTKEDKSAQED